jgi:hypothetical protein
MLNFFDDPGTTHLAFIPDDLLSSVAFCMSIKNWLYFFWSFLYQCIAKDVGGLEF